MSDILFIASTPMQVKSFIPVMQELVRRRHQVRILSLDPLKHEGASIALDNSSFSPIPFGGSVAEFGLLLQETHTDVIVVGNDQAPVEKAMVLLAQSCGVGSLLVQDGILLPLAAQRRQVMRRAFHLLGTIHHDLPLIRRLYEAYALISGSRLGACLLLAEDLGPRLWRSNRYGRGSCDRIAVSGPIAREMLVSDGAPIERVTVTGSPRFDALKYRVESARSLSDSMATRRRQAVLVATQPLVEDRHWSERRWLTYTTALLRALTHNGGDVMLKVHPRESAARYQNLLDSYPDSSNVTLYHKEDPAGLLSRASFVVTLYSTIAVEAMMCGIPVVVADLLDEYPHHPFADEQAAVRVTSEGELRRAVRRLLDGRESATTIAKRNAFVRHYASPLDGRAHLRIAEEAERLAELRSNAMHLE